MEKPKIYNLFQNVVSSAGSVDWFVAQIVKPLSRQRILDIGCGTASIVNQLPDVDYVGIDHNPEYIEVARKKFENRGTFHCVDINDLNPKTYGLFDTVLLVGVLHHLDDMEVQKILGALPSVLRTTSRVITFDVALCRGQNIFARILARLDRGRHVRFTDRYQALLESSFDIETVIVRHDLLKFPYTHAIFSARPKS